MMQKSKTEEEESEKKEDCEKTEAENSYYYDDAHGYEIYVPDEDDE